MWDGHFFQMFWRCEKENLLDYIFLYLGLLFSSYISEQNGTKQTIIKN